MTRLNRTATHRPAAQRCRFRHALVAVALFCVDEQTEIRTDTGRLRYDELAKGETVLMILSDGSAAEWQSVQAVNAFPRSS